MPDALISPIFSKIVVDGERRQARRRLVEEQHLGCGHERAREREHLTLAPGERPGRLSPALVEPREEREHLGEPLAWIGASAGERAQLEVLLDAHRREDVVSLRQRTRLRVPRWRGACCR